MFKKTTKEKFVAKQSYQIEKSEKSDETLSDKSYSSEKTGTATVDNSETKHDLTADEILIDKNGNIKAKGNVRYTGSKSGDITTNTLTEAFRQSNVEYAKESDVRAKESSKESLSDQSTVSVPSSKGIIWGTVGVLIIILVILWYFGIKIK
ncbi:hypothetical protein GCM10011418_32580 [Sphingobacterium alkalisoli]|nr:hypothetical protein GCM10011418_32580 [Sphingobacterium alkalisoli]